LIESRTVVLEGSITHLARSVSALKQFRTSRFCTNSTWTGLPSLNKIVSGWSRNEEQRRTEKYLATSRIKNLPITVQLSWTVCERSLPMQRRLSLIN